MLYECPVYHIVIQQLRSSRSAHYEKDMRHHIVEGRILAYSFQPFLWRKGFQFSLPALMRAIFWGSGSEDPLVMAGEVNISPLHLPITSLSPQGQPCGFRVQRGETQNKCSGWHHGSSPFQWGLSLLFLHSRSREVVCDKLQASAPRGRAWCRAWSMSLWRGSCGLKYGLGCSLDECPDLS